MVRHRRKVRFTDLRAERIPLTGWQQEGLHQPTEAPHAGHPQPGSGGEERRRRAVRGGDVQAQARGHQLAEQIDRGPLRRTGELLAVLLGPKRCPGLLQPGLQLGVPPDAVGDDADQLGGAAPAVRVGRLVACVRDVGHDRVLGAVPGLDVGQRLLDEIGNRRQPVHRADVAAGGVELAAQHLGVLHSAIPGLLGGQPRIAEPPPV